MRLHAYLVQALVPGDASLKYAQLPGIEPVEAKELLKEANALEELVDTLEEKKDERAAEVKKAVSHWGSLDLVDASFKGLLSSQLYH